MDDDGRVLIAFDGGCLLCSRSIRFLAGRDRADRLRFTRLQDEAGRAMRAAAGAAPPDSMLVCRDGRVLARSAAVLAVVETLGGPWRVLARLARLIPAVVRDRLYDFIAARRYRWFGKGDACALPDEALRKRLLP